MLANRLPSAMLALTCATILAPRLPSAMLALTCATILAHRLLSAMLALTCATILALILPSAMLALLADESHHRTGFGSQKRCTFYIFRRSVTLYLTNQVGKIGKLIGYGRGAAPQAQIR